MLCEVCPPGQYSSFGLSCGYCEVGKEPNVVEFGVGATHCTTCIDGTHRHNDGTADGVMQSCQSCAPGRQANDEQDECEACALGQYSDDGGDCIPCSTGTEPNSDQSACQSCPTGTKSDGAGMCEPCGVGETPDANQQYCVSCPSDSAGTSGVCTQCSAGEEPNAQQSACVACSAGKAGVGGSCGCSLARHVLRRSDAYECVWTYSGILEKFEFLCKNN